MYYVSQWLQLSWNYFVDINECLVDNGGCEFNCTNLVGLGYQCGCDTGYQLAPNNHNCNGTYTVYVHVYIMSLS